MGVRRAWADVLRGAVCLTVDDVLTTGATLVEANRALRAAGCEAVIAATVCATERRFSAVSQRGANPK
jgi:predicted amidophosphoribosyltransferase